MTAADTARIAVFRWITRDRATCARRSDDRAKEHGEEQPPRRAQERFPVSHDSSEACRPGSRKLRPRLVDALDVKAPALDAALAEARKRPLADALFDRDEREAVVD